MFSIKMLIISSLTLFSLLLSCNQQNSEAGMPNNHEGKEPNHLINESSPYLLQHAYNPVDWRPWSKATLEQAKAEDKMMIISIGYAACHWCHVMEHESFEDSAVAALMNEYFIPVKVDREERPDVDQIYMDAVQLITGRGGWPLNAIALPDGRPVYAGTYFPKDDWMRVLDHFKMYYQNQRDDALERAAQITEGIRGNELVSLNPNPAAFSKEELDLSWSKFEERVDFNKGGRKGAPKFPMPTNWEFALRYHALSGNEKALEAVEVTLIEMAFGGIYDQIGGGFARYSVDADWVVPHFEKMLYDNGQLVSIYAQAYQQSGNQMFKELVYQTIEFVERELQDEQKGFYSSLDADSEGVEGKFYVWSFDEIKAMLGHDEELLNAYFEYYDISQRGNFEGHNILVQLDYDQVIADKLGLSVSDLRELIDQGDQILMKERDKRIRPGLDDKVLTAWNALMLKGYVDAYRAFNDEELLKKALQNATFLLENCVQKDGRLNRNYKNGKSSINAFLDDYSLTIEAFIALYQATFDEAWLTSADKLTQYVNAHFYNIENGMYFYTSDIDDPLIARKMETSDNVIPASNSSMAKALFQLGTFLGKDDYIKKAERMLNNVKENVIGYPNFYSNWAILMSWFAVTPYEVAILGEDHQKFRAALDKNFYANVFYLGGTEEGDLELLNMKLVEGQTTIYVCQNKVCKLPVTSVEEARKLIVNQYN